MENNEEIYEFDDLDIVDYINTKHSYIDLIEIESEKNKQKALLKRIDSNLYEFFIQSSDSLLSLLDTYKVCLSILKNFKSETKTTVQLANGTSVSEELVKKFGLFKDDMKIYLTENRYFVFSSVFNDGNIICVLTNDILFIGEKDRENKFKLIRSVPKQLIKLQIKDKELEIVCEKEKLLLKAEEKQIEEFFDVFNEINYVFTAKKENICYDDELISFYIETENYEELVKYLEQVNNSKIGSIGYEYNSTADRKEKENTYEWDKLFGNKTDNEQSINKEYTDPCTRTHRKALDKETNNSYGNDYKTSCNSSASDSTSIKSINNSSTVIFEKINIKNEMSLKCAIQLSKNPLDVCNPYLINRFMYEIEQLNQIKEFDLFISDVFSLLEEYIEFVENFFTENNFSHRSLVLFIEECVVKALKYLERRIRMHSKLLGNKEAMDQIKEKLLFKKYDFRYLVKKIINYTYKGTEKMISRAKAIIQKETGSDKRRNIITLIEVGITNQDILHTVETEKLRKYDLLANELSLVHKCKVNIIPFVLTWDGIVTTYHEKYRKDFKVSNRIEAYIQSKVLHKTLESVSLDYRRKCEDGISEREVMTVVNKDLLATTIESI